MMEWAYGNVGKGRLDDVQAGAMTSTRRHAKIVELGQSLMRARPGANRCMGWGRSRWFGGR